MNTIGPLGAGQVRVDAAYGLEPQKAPHDRPDKSHAPGEAEPAAEPAGRIELDAAHKRLIAMAAALDEVDSRAVEQARRLLDSGRLDTPQAAARAAGAILDQGL
ncbi:MAG: hypothetical protein J7M21_04190 [Planctomycetes bacterium]|nr:hypothetical protein [Planctomycetota bacterium]